MCRIEECPKVFSNNASCAKIINPPVHLNGSVKSLKKFFAWADSAKSLDGIALGSLSNSVDWPLWNTCHSIADSIRSRGTSGPVCTI